MSDIARLRTPAVLIDQAKAIRNLDDFILVTDDELFASIRLLFEHTHNVAEGAGAAALAAAVKIKGELSGKKVGLDLSGGNITAEILKKIL